MAVSDCFAVDGDYYGCVDWSCSRHLANHDVCSVVVRHGPDGLSGYYICPLVSDISGTSSFGQFSKHGYELCEEGIVILSTHNRVVAHG